MDAFAKEESEKDLGRGLREEVSYRYRIICSPILVVGPQAVVHSDVAGRSLDQGARRVGGRNRTLAL